MAKSDELFKQVEREKRELEEQKQKWKQHYDSARQKEKEARRLKAKEDAHTIDILDKFLGRWLRENTPGNTKLRAAAVKALAAAQGKHADAMRAVFDTAWPEQKQPPALSANAEAAQAAAADAAEKQ